MNCYLLTPKISKRLTKQQCLSLLQCCQSLAELKKVHAQLFRVSLHQDKDSMDKLMAACTDPLRGDFQYAEKVFNYVHVPSLFVYNVMIKSCVKKGSLRQAVNLFYCLREDGLWPDNFTYPFVLKTLASLKFVLEGQMLHGLLVKTGLESDSYISNSLLDMYAEVGYVQCIYKIFNGMINRDIISWNIMISGLTRCKRFQEAISVYQQVLRRGLVPDEATFASTLSACSTFGDVNVGKGIHGCMNKQLEFRIILGNSLLDMYFKCGSTTMAENLFKDMPFNNVISWTTMISGYVNHGKQHEARELFQMCRMKDVVLWTSMINGCVQHKQFDEALSLFKQMRTNNVRPDKFTAVSVLTACAHLGELEQGLQIYELVEAYSIKIDSFVGTALIELYSKCGYIEKSMEVFLKVKEKDTAIWTAIVCGLAINGKASKALELFSEMTTVGIKPDHITFVGVLTACRHGGLIVEGRKYFTSMRSMHNLEPTIEHYGCYIDLLGRAGWLEEAEKLIESIDKEEDVFPLWVPLLAACRVHGNIEIGERVAKRVDELETRSSGPHSLLANIYAGANRWEDMTKVRSKMKEFGVIKLPGCSSIDLSAGGCSLIDKSEKGACISGW